MCFDNTKNQNPLSIVIPVRNRWEDIRACLESIDLQNDPPQFEVIIVDDGSTDTIPDTLIIKNRTYVLQVLRQNPLGVSAARNHGFSKAKGSIVLFVDSDCLLHPNCLLQLHRSTQKYNCDIAFQLRLAGKTETILGKIEELERATKQKAFQTPDGRIRWLNTSGFAIRKDIINVDQELFDVKAIRGQDTVLLVNLYKQGHLPRFLNQAIIFHCPNLSLFRYITKQFIDAYINQTSRHIAGKTGNILTSNLKRFKMILMLLSISKERSIGILPVFLFSVCFCLTILGRIIGQISIWQTNIFYNK